MDLVSLCLFSSLPDVAVDAADIAAAAAAATAIAALLVPGLGALGSSTYQL